MVESREPQDIIFRALADPSRRAMIEQLSAGAATVGDLAEPLEMTLAGASKHIGILEQAGLLRREKRGRERICTLQPEGLLAAREWVERYSRFWTERLDALDAALSEKEEEKR